MKINKTTFPAPDCEMGYSPEHLEWALGRDLYVEFQEWHAGQTGSICDGRRYDHESKTYYPTACAEDPHGFVAYTWDVHRWLGFLGQESKEIWD